MNTADASHRAATGRQFPAHVDLEAPGRAYPTWPDYPGPRGARRASRPLAATALLSYQTPSLPMPQHQAYRPRRLASAATDPPLLSGHAHAQPVGQRWIRKRWTWPQRAGGLLIAATFMAAVTWYVPRVLSADRQLLTGTVMSSGVVTLNFAGSGEISAVNVHVGQAVRKGQVLAAEYAPDVESVMNADQAAIASDRARVKMLKAAEAANPAEVTVDNAQIAATDAQLAADEAQSGTDRMKAAAMQILAPEAGVVVAVNGQPGQVVTASGIRNYTTDSAQASTARSLQFSLLPEGPQPMRGRSPSTSALPLIALRTSAAWQVVAQIPESSVARVVSGQVVTISVPAAHITGVPGRIDGVLPTPESTSQGTVYQVVVTITGRVASPPMNGMAADIRLAS